MSFNYLEQGYCSGFTPKEISIYEFVGLIQHNPHRDKIQHLRTLERGSKEYDAIKKQLPCIKAHGTFDSAYKKEHFKEFSGFIYFDIDQCDAEALKQEIILKYRDKVCMVGTSVGGKGVFFFVQVSKPELVTADNFQIIQEYFIDNVFSALNVDRNAKGVVRNHVISYDPGLYSDLNVKVIVPELLHPEKSITGRNKRERGCITRYDTFLDIKECNQHIKWKTEYDIGEEDYVIGDFKCATLFVPKEIKDGKKHQTYRAMVNQIMYNKPDIESKYVVSFINYINQNHTEGRPMRNREMVSTVQAEYDRIKETGEYYGISMKHVITNPNLDRETRQRLGAKGWGEYRVRRSVELIEQVVKDLQLQQAKPTQKMVAEILTGKLSIAAIKRHWRKVVPKSNDSGAGTQMSEAVINNAPSSSGSPVNDCTTIVPEFIMAYEPQDDGSFLASTAAKLTACKQWLIRNYKMLDEWDQDSLVEYLLEKQLLRLLKGSEAAKHGFG